MRHFTILEELGNQKKRKFSKVFRVCCDDDPQPYVLKTVEKNESTILQQNKLIQESKFNLISPNFQKTIDFWEDDTNMYLLKEFKLGDSLEIWWKNNKISKLDKLKIFVEHSIPIFKFLNTHQIAHNDIKPSNFLVCEENSEIHLTLIDFGLAHTIPAKNDGEVLFSLGFSAPEVILSQKSLVNHSSDLFSLGICMYYLYSGKLPLSHPNPSIFTNLQITHPLVNETGIPKKLFELLSKICVKHSFRLPPNQLPIDEVHSCLLNAREKRIQTIYDIWKELNEISEKKYWIF
jgi:serine/threonine protein kinase